MRNYKKYLAPLVIITVISWTAFILVLIRLEPCRSYSSTGFCGSVSTIGVILFGLSLFFALTGLYTILGYLSRILFYKQEVHVNHFNISLRQGILLSTCSEAALIFLSVNVLRWWTALLLFGMIVLIEFYFLSKDPI